LSPRAHQPCRSARPCWPPGASRHRPYHAPRRQEQAQRTYRAILDAAGELSVRRGYAPTTMNAVAEAAGVALDTVYAAVGPKPVLFRLLVPERRPAQHLPITRGH